MVIFVSEALNRLRAYFLYGTLKIPGSYFDFCKNRIADRIFCNPSVLEVVLSVKDLTKVRKYDLILEFKLRGGGYEIS